MSRWNPQPAIIRVLTRCHREGDCLVFDGYRDEYGYGRARGDDGRSQPTHRIVWSAVRGPIPEGMTLDHLCVTTGCCNADHLEVVTPAENSRRVALRDHGGPLIAICATCGVQFRARRRFGVNRRFCSRDCVAEATRRQPRSPSGQLRPLT